MKRNFFTKCLLVFMRVQTCSVISRGIRWIRRTRFLRIAMRCSVSVWDFGGPMDSPFSLDCKNLTNQRYASSIDVIADARAEPNLEIFHPGDGRSFYGGASWSW